MESLDKRAVRDLALARGRSEAMGCLRLTNPRFLRRPIASSLHLPSWKRWLEFGSITLRQAPINMKARGQGSVTPRQAEAGWAPEEPGVRETKAPTPHRPGGSNQSSPNIYPTH